MPITCFIRYRIDATKAAQLEEYARNWGQCIPSCGADLVGYFAPHEGSASTAYGVHHIDSLADYEAYRARLIETALGKSSYELARRERFLIKEDRLFLRLVPDPHLPVVKS